MFRFSHLALAVVVAGTALLLAAAFPAAAGFMLWNTARSDFPMEVRGSFRPVLFRTSFDVTGFGLDWDRKVRVENGRLHVDFEWPERDGTRVVITASRLPVSLGEAWREVSAKKNTVLDVLNADVILGPEGIREIKRIEARSPEMHFSLGTETR